VTRIAVSGHRGLSPDVAMSIDKAVRDELAPFAGNRLVGLTCLADGADQIFARAVLDLGGQIEVFVPAAKYRDGLPAETQPAYDELLGRATTVHRLDHKDSTSESHMDASVAMLANADRLFAVWDGQPARAFGGTADVVEHARSRGVPVTVVWPEGAHRN
jgi:hypothetical protein